jgi:putative DNA primase/helicase
MFLSTGEVTLQARLAEAGKRPLTGMDIRLINIEADPGKGLGVFETLHDMPDGAALADHLRSASKTFYGTAGRAFVQRLTEEYTADKAGFRRLVNGLRDRFITDPVPDGADGQLKSVAGRFGVVMAAGALATVWGILPWDENQAERATAMCFNAWLAERGTTGAGEDEAAVRQVRQFIEQHGVSRFQVVRQGGSFVDDESYDVLGGETCINRAGWRQRGKDGRGEWTYYVLPEMWRQEVCKGIDPNRAARVLAERGFLERGEGKNLAKKTRIPEHGTLRVYVMSGRIMAGEDSALDDPEEDRIAPITTGRSAIHHRDAMHRRNATGAAGFPYLLPGCQ